MKYANIQVITPENMQDFIDLYRVFEEPPYEEFFSEEELKEEYNRLSTLGHVVGYYVDGKCVGMTAFYKAANEEGRADPEHPIYYEHYGNVAYFSDVTVLKEYRCKGIGSILMEYAIDTCRNEGCNIMYMRTLQAGQSMSYGIAIKHGFKVLENVTQNVVQARVNDERVKEDKRIFLEKQLV